MFAAATTKSHMPSPASKEPPLSSQAAPQPPNQPSPATKPHAPSPALKKVPLSSQAAPQPPNQPSPATKPHAPSPALKKAPLSSLAAAAAQPLKQPPTQNRNVLSTPAAVSSIPVQQQKYVFHITSPPQPVLAKVDSVDVPSIRRTSPSVPRTTTKQFATHPVLLRSERQNNLKAHQQKKKNEAIWKKRTETLPVPAESRSKGDSPHSAKVFESLDEMIHAAQSDLTYSVSNL